MEYIPGQCNMDARGQRKRATFGYIATALGIIIAVVIFFTAQSLWWMLLVFVFLWVGMLGILQAKHKFCVANAAKSQYEVNGKMTPIKEKHAQLLDKKKAQEIHFRAIGYAIIITSILTLLTWLF